MSFSGGNTMASDGTSPEFSVPAMPKAGRGDEVTRLALALCHEIANLVSGVRLQAHLLAPELSNKELATASVEIEDLCARSSAWLNLMRPLLSEVPRSGEYGVLPSAVLSALHYILEDCGGRGVGLSVECREGLPEVAADPDTVQQLLLTLVFGAMETARPRGHVSIRGLPGRDADEVRLVVEDDGEDELRDWDRETLRGRPLACALASQILAQRGGGLDVDRSQGTTRVTLRLPRR
jgi:C4-dicarboxylate-specific signal transduction histidine kinase